MVLALPLGGEGVFPEASSFVTLYLFPVLFVLAASPAA